MMFYINILYKISSLYYLETQILYPSYKKSGKI